MRTFEKTNLKCTDLRFLQTFSGKEFYYKYPNGDESYSVIALFKATKLKGDLQINDDEGLELNFFQNKFPPLEKRAKILLDKIKANL